MTEPRNRDLLRDDWVAAGKGTPNDFEENWKSLTPAQRRVSSHFVLFFILSYLTSSRTQAKSLARVRQLSFPITHITYMPVTQKKEDKKTAK